MVVRASRLVVRAIFVCALAFCALLLLGSRAHALADDPTPADAGPATPVSTPPPGPDTLDSTPPPTVPQSEPTAPTPRAPTDPTVRTRRPPRPTRATRTTRTPRTRRSPPPVPRPRTPASNRSAGDRSRRLDHDLVDTTHDRTTTTTSGAEQRRPGATTATGEQSNSTVTQQVSATTTGNATVDVLQIALVVNVGVAHSTSGNNVVGAGSTPPSTVGSAKAVDQTGNALATGDTRANRRRPRCERRERSEQ